MTTAASASSLPVVDDCWNGIGVRGDRSCPELVRLQHCHNCPVFSRAAQTLLDRPVDGQYFAERARFLAEPLAVQDKAQLAAVVFDVGSELYALEATRVVEVTESRPARRVPHRSGAVFRGLVNVNGQLELCFSLAGLIGVGEGNDDGGDTARRAVVTLLDGRRWVLSVDRVRGVQRFEPSSIREAPLSSARRTAPLIKSLLVSGEDRVGLLDAEALRTSLEASLR